MRIALIAAMAENRVIGVQNRLPWRLPGDLKWFKRQTVGKPVVMGRKTFESIGRPLPDRRNIVVSREPSFAPEGCVVVSSVDAALSAASDSREVMIMGGASLYEQLLPRADRLYLTLVHATVDGDAFFPFIDWNEWREVEREEHAAEDDQHAYTFLILDRAASAA